MPFCLQCVELKPEFAKGFSRLGAAYHGIGDFDEAISAYEQGELLVQGVQLCTHQ